MNVLILSCNTGEGHNSAARALKQYLDAHNVRCTVTDTLSIVGNSFSEAISDMYLYSTRTGLFRYLYNIGEAVSERIRYRSIIYLWNMMYADRLLEHIEDGNYDAVICVHLFPAEAMTYLRQSGKTDIPAIFVMTDYTCIPFLKETDLDSYIIPHEHLIEEFASRGIPRERLHPFGIPIDRTFQAHGTKAEARAEAAEHFGWDIRPDRHWFLVMTGSMGFGNTQDIIDETIRQSFDETEIIVICGRNVQMLEELQEENRYIPNIHILGFTDRIPLLMDACDVLFTKPGGISSTEAMSKGIPIIHTAPIPGCETRNAEFFHYHGMSYSSTDAVQQVRTALRLCEDRIYRNAMTDAQRLNARPDTCRYICDLLQSASDIREAMRAAA